MITTCLRWLPLAAMLLGVAPGQAQSPPGGATPPTSLHYRSVFDGYRRHDDQRVGPWQEVNDTVGRIGGWRTYARESAPGGGGTPATPAAAPASPAGPAPSGTGVPPAPAGSKSGAHGGHGARP